MDEHHDSGLARSLGIFLHYVFDDSLRQLIALRPAPLSREDWMAASDETKQVHLKWQSNLTYLKQRLAHFALMCNPRQPKKSRFDDFEVLDYDAL